MNSGPARERLQPWIFRIGTAVWLLLGIVLLGSALQARTAARPSTPARSAGPDSASLRRGYVPQYELRNGTEVVLVLLGASFCGAQHKPGFAQAVEDAKQQVRRQAVAGGAQFRAVAVSLDWDPKEAMEFLAGFGAFDEISVGSNWLNEGAQRYIWRDHQSDPVVPQIVVIERQVETAPAIKTQGERVLQRVQGSDQIIAWVRAGARI
ncbi:MAG: hypothetical protein KY467_18210 [Gemmatimonadetes bacterium]|nr:hypothetical protein [Gemmatimonadota bacterium]